MSAAPTRSGGGLSLRGTALVGIGLISGQIATWVLMLVSTRALGPTEYGLFGTLTAILVVGSTVPNAVQVVVSRHVAGGGAEAHVGVRSVFFVGMIGTALLFAALVALTSSLRLDLLSQGVPLALALFPLTVSGAQLGILQGRESHLRLGALYFVVAGCRSGFGIVGALTIHTTTGVIISMAIGALTAAAIGTLMVPKLDAGQHAAQLAEDETGPQLLREVGHALHALIVLFALTNVDILLARATLPEFEAGLYAAGALVNRAVFFMPYAILIAAFPRMVAGTTTAARRQSIVAVGAFGLAAAAGCFLLPDLALAFVAGERYRDVAESLWIFALAGAGFGVLQVVLYSRLASSDRRAATMLWILLAALIALGLTIGGSGVEAMATCAAAVAWAGAIIGAAQAWRTDSGSASGEAKES